MRKTIKLTERDLMRIVKRTMNESQNLNEFFFNERKRKFQRNINSVLNDDSMNIKQMASEIMSICREVMDSDSDSNHF